MTRALAKVGARVAKAARAPPGQLAPAGQTRTDMPVIGRGRGRRLRGRDRVLCWRRVVHSRDQRLEPLRIRRGRHHPVRKGGVSPRSARGCRPASRHWRPGSARHSTTSAGTRGGPRPSLTAHTRVAHRRLPCREHRRWAERLVGHWGGWQPHVGPATQPHTAPHPSGHASRSRHGADARAHGHLAGAPHLQPELGSSHRRASRAVPDRRPALLLRVSWLSPRGLRRARRPGASLLRHHPRPGPQGSTG
jgi:hypothetical protein